MSHLDWTSNLPTAWETKPLRAVAECRVSNVDKVTVEGEKAVRLCNYTDVYNNEFIHPNMDFMQATATESEIGNFKLSVGDIVITKDSETWEDIGVPALVTETADDLLCGYHLALLRPQAGVLSGRFLLRVLQARQVQVQLELTAKGMTRYGLPKFEIGKTVLPLPPLPTQSAIADYLDQETARLDALIAAHERLLGLLAEKRQAIVTSAVTRGLDPHAPTQDSGVPWLNGTRKLKYVAKFSYGDSLSDDARQSDEFRAFGSNGPYAGSAISNTEAPAIVIGRKGSYGKVSWSTEKCFASDTTFFIDRRTCGHELRWLYWVLQTLQLNEGTDEAAIPGLNREAAHNRKLVVPSRSTQRNIADYVDRETSRLDALLAKVDQSVNLLQERRTALISAAVTGQVSVGEGGEGQSK